MAYDDQNIFAKILRGELPAIKLYEDDQVLAFMDIMPPSRWSCISYSKNSCSNFT
ncbi:diadenosine tetraphosphate (Ap4A) hydrolase [Acinetobacter baumannii ABNIH7]|nr:diadenosine tetraphosphate (Ap4A) hydrolase [Acinetobacter baumannii ABNIH7]